MKISTIHAGRFKLDGGAMFGVVPKTLWTRGIEPDEKNLCTWAMRCLLIETGDRKILVDTGIGDKQDAKWQSFFEPHGPETLKGSLAEKGLTFEDITDVFLTHLHFDHVGGAVSKNEAGELVPTFPNATYWSNEQHWDWAYTPNAREQASFLKENFVPLKEKGQLEMVSFAKGEEFADWLPGIRLQKIFGHTDAMMMLHLDTAEQGKFVYCADLIPSSLHISMPYVMAYDVRPLDTLKEKAALYENALEAGAKLIFEHDPKVACAEISMDEKGRIKLGETFGEI
jgi:glyoxylase-like metal-dependent hydrolase (beta-lactamase superfamily II)